MKRITVLVFAMFIGLISFAQNQKKDLLEIYYFHRTERCVTCNAIEGGVRSTLEKYKKEIAEGDLVFKSINFEQETEKNITKIKNTSDFFINYTPSNSLFICSIKLYFILYKSFEIFTLYLC